MFADPKQYLLYYYHNQPYGQLLNNPDFSSKVLHPSCGDSIIITGRVNEGYLIEIGYSSQGCMLGQAAASLVAQKVLGLHLENILNLNKEDLQELIKLPLGPIRFKCVELPLQALQEAIRNYVICLNSSEH